MSQELAYFGKDFTDSEEYAGQLKFIETHAYFTATARRLRDDGQLKSVAALRQALGELDLKR